MVHHQYRIKDSHDPFLSQNTAFGLQLKTKHFNLRLPTYPAMSRPSWHQTNSSTRERWAPTWPPLALHPAHRSPPDPSLWAGTRTCCLGRVLGGCGACWSPPSNCSTELGHQRCHRRSESQEKRFQQQPGNRHQICFFHKLQQTTISGIFFFRLTNSWNLLIPISMWLYSSLHSSGAETTK